MKRQAIKFKNTKQISKSCLVGTRQKHNTISLPNFALGKTSLLHRWVDMFHFNHGSKSRSQSSSRFGLSHLVLVHLIVFRARRNIKYERMIKKIIGKKKG